MRKYAVIVAGGIGSRMGADKPKQFLEVNGKPIVQITVEKFLEAFEDIEIIVVLPEQHQKTGEKILAADIELNKVITTTGGETRFHSVKKGLSLVPENAIVFVHDAVRCLVSAELIKRCFESALENGNAIPAIEVKDSIRVETEDGFQIADRSRLRIIQTPQTFFSNSIKRAFEQEYHESFTDEATVAETFGIKIHLVKGEEQNIKITNPFDLQIASFHLTAEGAEKP